MAVRFKARKLVLPAEPVDLTRAKLLAAAGEVFAERGFQATTVREICALAGANVAAVNYHFRDKQGLYLETLRENICAASNSDLQAVLATAESPEDALRLFVTEMLRMLASRGDVPARGVRIVAHELAAPSEAFAHVVDQVMRPRYAKLREILSGILGLDADHETTRLCAHSIVGQIVHYAHARPIISLLWPDFSLTPQRAERIADHIVEFSLCSLRAMGNKKFNRAPGEATDGSTAHHD